MTICTADRRKLFTDGELVALLIEMMLEQFRAFGFAVYAYCFMPDHCHILAAGLTDTCELPKAVRAFKGIAVVRARWLGIRNLWQSSYYDHMLRSTESFDAAAAYIFENPVRAGLVRDAREWPFSGSFVFAWKNLATPREKFVPRWKLQGRAAG